MGINKPLMYKYLLPLFVAIVFFVSCKGKDTVAPSDKNPPEVVTINTTPDTINIYQNGVRQNNASSIYPNGATTYLPFLRGTQNYQFKRTGTTDVLFTKAVTVDSATSYTFFVAGTTADKFFTTTDAIIPAVDTINNDQTDTRSMIRVVNASYDAGPVTVSIASTAGTVSVNNLPFGTATAFMKFNASPINQHIQVTSSAGNTVSYTMTFNTGFIYTLYTKGSPTGTGDSAFGMGLTTNQYIPLNL